VCEIQMFTKWLLSFRMKSARGLMFILVQVLSKMKSFLFIVYILLLFHHAFSQCNGYEDLCSKRYNKVAYLTTHNAYNTKDDGFKLPNQEWNISTQLKYGVRALMFDVYEESDELVVYHGFKILGSKPFIEVLNEIREFMEENPKEVVTIILECYVNSNQIASEIEDSGLSKYLYTKNKHENWGTLKEMIDDNTRLVVFSDKNDAEVGQEWYHYMWDFAVETHYANHNLKDFNNDFNRGKENAETKDLVILNHFLTKTITGVGSIQKSKKANSILVDRINTFHAVTGRFPNFITVDFVDIGNVKEVIDCLNGSTKICH